MKVLANFEDNQKIQSNSSIDSMLGGGFEKGTITQIFGPPSSGKSNIALTLAVNVARNNKKVVYIDTEGGISIDRIKQISGPDFSNVANKIIVFEPTNFLEQNENLRSIDIWLRKNHNDVDLIILDSAVALYRVDDMKPSKLNKELGKQMGLLSKIARQYDVAVVVTNQIYSAIEYLKPIISKYKIPLKNIVTHEMVRKAYKNKYPKKRCSGKVDVTQVEYKRFIKYLKKEYDEK
jgi:DNA repair protein RadB